MKKIYIIKKIVLPLCMTLFAILLTSCFNDLDKNPLDSLSTPTFWKTENDAILALTGVYHQEGMTGTSAKQSFSLWNQDTYLRLFEATTDNGFEKDNNVTDINNGSLASTYAPVFDLWITTYRKIARCNNFLENVDAVTMDLTKLADMKAEVRTIRAHDYFWLQFLWGDVPMPQKILSVNEANTILRTPREEVLKFVIDELKAAIPNLPITRADSDYGRICRGGAMAILGRVYLAEKRWAEAKDIYKQIIDLGVYSIDARFSDLFTAKGENSSEFLLVSKRMQDLYSNSIPLSCLGFTWGGYHHYSPYNELVEEFECIDGKHIRESDLYEVDDPYKNRDPRLLKTIFVDRVSVFKDITYIAHPDSSAAKYPDQLTRRPWSGYMVRKFCDENYSGNAFTYGCDFPMIRYAEVLLSYLEACVESNTPITQDLLDQTINRVRGRTEVNMPPVTEIEPNALRTRIVRERRVELAWEGLRLFDLFRWRKAHIILKGSVHGMKLCSKAEAPTYTKSKVDENGYYFCEETFFRENIDYLWPIPQSERDVNPNLTQNPGY